ncbi:hypothetical protein MTO96_024441 [Rhipicephalus appendiculatus]
MALQTKDHTRPFDSSSVALARDARRGPRVGMPFRLAFRSIFLFRPASATAKDVLARRQRTADDGERVVFARRCRGRERKENSGDD